MKHTEVNKMKVYAAIGHFKDNKNMVCVAMTQLTKKAFMQDCYGNEFVPYVVITEPMLEKFLACADCMEIFDQVKKLTSNYRVWNDVTDYIEQCSDIISDKMEAAKKVEIL
ncbi:hypothetical protein [Bacteroides acidifaciens]|uniref:hypothetical protein n=1 Tax=Bacteroides acidifaciens TaxID=85831 RepID=UPI0025A17984|nr:hypothetical protein [Bacteroides acidifaciens]